MKSKKVVSVLSLAAGLILLNSGAALAQSESAKTGAKNTSQITPIKTDAKGGSSGSSSGTTSGTISSTTSGTAGDVSADAKVTPLESAEETDPTYDAYLKEEAKQQKVLQEQVAVDHFNASKHYMSKWDLELTELELRAAIMYMPSLKIAHRDYCIVAMMRGKLLRSLAEFLMVIGLGDPIPLNEQQQQELREEASRAHYKKGLEHAESNHWEEAISELLWSKTYLPNDPAIYRSLAFAYATKGDYKTAQGYYQEALQIDPGDPYAHADFAFLLNKKGKTDLAVSQMAQAIKLNPNATALHVDLGWMAESKGDLETARREFQKSVELSPKHASLWSKLAEVQAKMGKKELALGAYKKAVELDPTDMETKAAMDALVQTAPPAPAVEQSKAPAATPRATEKPAVQANGAKTSTGVKTDKLTPLK